MLLLRWGENVTRDSDNAPLVSPAFIADQGPGVQIADIRPREAATGVLGYIPGSLFSGIAQLEKLAQEGGVGIDDEPLKEAMPSGYQIQSTNGQ